MANNPNAKKNLRPFVKGDPRINLKGRPKSFDKLRKLAQKVAANPAMYDEEDERTISAIELMFLNMSKSTNPADRRMFLEYAYGKVKDEVDLNVGGKLAWAKFIEDDNSESSSK